MNKKSVEIILTRCGFFSQTKTEIYSIYKNDPVEKCFLIKDVLTNTNYKVRLSTKEFPNTVKNEYNAINYLRSQNIEWAPKIYFSSFNDDYDIIIYEYFDGQSIDKSKYFLTAKDFKSIQSKLTLFIAQIHSLKGTYFGDFVDAFFSSWHDYFERKLYNHVKNAYNIGLLNEKDIQIIEMSFAKNQEYYNGVNSHFLHFDIKPTNIVYNKKTNTTVLIDFELSRFGDIKIEHSRLISYYERPDKLYKQLFIPLAKKLPELRYYEYIKTSVFHLYNLYNLLAYYTTSLVNNGINRKYLINPIKNTLSKLR